jgi:hypothetical protein
MRSIAYILAQDNIEEKGKGSELFVPDDARNCCEAWKEGGEEALLY